MEAPKEKAESLVEKFKEIRVFEDVNGGFPLDDAEAIKCAKIAVDEISTLLPNINETPPIKRDSEDKYFQYWIAVKNELNKL